MPGELPTPAGTLYRIGRAPSPLDLPPWGRQGSGRFDDPRPNPVYRVRYVGERRACFYECLASFRVALDGISSQGITNEWLSRRRIAALRFENPVQHFNWLDLASPETYFEFRTTFSEQLHRLGFTDFDVSAATSDRRALTQPIGQWAHEHGYAGIRYITRHAPLHFCWAVFDSTTYETVDARRELALDDTDLRIVARQWRLDLPR
jgi:hypothetical protein